MNDQEELKSNEPADEPTLPDEVSAKPNDAAVTMPSEPEMVSFNLDFSPGDLHRDMEDDLRADLDAEFRPASMIDFGEVVIYGTPDEPMDIDAALASVIDLDRVLAERDAAEAAERARQEAETRAAEEAARRRHEYYFPRPPLTTLMRGQLASVVPALVLIGVGAWLTFALAAADSVSPVLVGMVMAGGLGVILLSQWLTSGRWAMGAAFTGLGILFSLGVIVFLSQTNDPGADGWPLVIVALGAAVLIAAMFSQFSGGRLVFTGVALIAAGLVTLAVTMGLNTQIVDLIQQSWPIVLGVALFLLLLPIAARRRG